MNSPNESVITKFYSQCIIKMPFDILEQGYETKIKPEIIKELNEIAPDAWTMGVICHNMWVDIWFLSEEAALNALFYISLRYNYS